MSVNRTDISRHSRINTIHCFRTFASAWMSGLSFFSVTDFNVARSFSSLLKTFSLFSRFVVNPSRPDPGRREKVNSNFYFQTSLGCLRRLYEGFKGLHRTFWGIKKKYENKISVNWMLDASRTPSYDVTLVRLSLPVCSSVRPSLSFLKIGSLFFSDIHDSCPWYIVTNEARSLKKKHLWPKFGPNKPKSGPKWGFLPFA